MTARDVTNDGASDLVWWNDDGTLGYWDFGPEGVSFVTLGNLSRAQFSLISIGDITGDGSQDIVFRQQQTATTRLDPGDPSSDYQMTAQNFGYWDMDQGQITAWHETHSNIFGGHVAQGAAGLTGRSLSLIGDDRADFMGDGRMSFILRSVDASSAAQTATYSIQALASEAAAYTTYSLELSTSWYIAELGRFNGGETTDILWRDSATNMIGMHSVEAGVSVSWTSFGEVGQNWQIVESADFNGDGADDLLWRETTTNDYGFWFMGGTGEAVAPSWSGIGAFASDWRVAATGDFMGDGSADLIWRNSSTGEMQLWDYDGGVLGGYMDLGTVSLDWHIA